MMENNQTNNQNQNLLEGEKNEWVFIPLLKAHILKRTDTYVAFLVDGIASGIISAKFLRKKETETMVYFSVPATYEVNCRVREFVNGKWVTTLETKVLAKDIKERITAYNNIK